MSSCTMAATGALQGEQPPDGVELGIPASGKAGAQLPEFGAFAEGDDELSARDAAGRALAQAVTTPPSTPEKMRFGRRECRPFKPEFATSPGPLPMGKWTIREKPHIRNGQQHSFSFRCCCAPLLRETQSYQ